MRAWVLALALGGCGFSSPAATSNGNDPDGGGQVPPDGSDGSGPDPGVVHLCLGTFVKVCADAPRGSLSLMTGMIDTSDVSASSKCLPSTAYTTEPAVDACVIASQTITIPSGNTVSVTGGKRLILFADETLTITGTLDAASHHGGLSGPATDSGPCPPSAKEPNTATQGAGAWGGTFGEPGGSGGNTVGGAIGGIPGSALQITAFGGGCPGGNGANNSENHGGGKGGHGGGAVLLLAGSSITIDGIVNASGGGGSGGSSVGNTHGGGGGGGGGSGGMIVVEAPTVRISGQCFANGGAGGQGSSVLDGDSGGESGAPDKAASNKNRNLVGGDGASGGVGTTGSKSGGNGGTITGGMPPVTDTGGGGAGGGGVGIIKILSADPGATSDPKKVSPPPS